jgi:molecular chaperone GrpE (heat shock protein)
MQKFSNVLSGIIKNYGVYILWAAVFTIMGLRYLLTGWDRADELIAAGIGFTVVLIGLNVLVRGEERLTATGTLFSAISIFIFILYAHALIKDVPSVFLYLCAAILLVTAAWSAANAIRAKKLAQPLPDIPGQELKALDSGIAGKTAVILAAVGALLFFTFAMTAIDAYWADIVLFSVLGMSLLLFAIDIYYRPSLRMAFIGLLLTLVTIGVLYLYTPLMDMRGIRYVAAFFYIFGSAILAYNGIMAVINARKAPVLTQALPREPEVQPAVLSDVEKALLPVEANENSPYEDRYASSISHQLVTTQEMMQGLQSEIKEERFRHQADMEKSMKKVLNVLDSSESYLNKFKDKNIEGYGRVEYIRDMIVEDILTPAGVKKTNVSPGEAVDGIRCKLADGQEAPRGFNGIPKVLRVVKDGYMLDTMVLRPAEVEANWEDASQSMQAASPEGLKVK